MFDYGSEFFYFNFLNCVLMILRKIYIFFVTCDTYIISSNANFDGKVTKESI
jgi:hypothetical protein